MKALSAQAAVLVVAWPLLLGTAPHHNWCTVPLPPPAPVPAMPAPVTVTSVPVPAVPAPRPAPNVSRRGPRSPAPPRHRARNKSSAPFISRGNLVVPTPGGRRRTLSLVILLVVVLAPCAAAAVTRYGKNR
jgi:hypothetical protein